MMKTDSRDLALRELAPIWLRDSCGCAECRDADSGQRLLSITDLPADVWLTTTRAAGDSIEVVFGLCADLDGVGSALAVLRRSRAAGA